MGGDVFEGGELGGAVRALSDPAALHHALEPSPPPPSEPSGELSGRWRAIRDRIERTRAEALPSDEPGLSGGPPWRRAPRRWLFALTRPVRRRSDGLSSELAELGALLAEHAERTRAELEDLRRSVERLRDEVDATARAVHRLETGGPGSPPGDPRADG